MNPEHAKPVVLLIDDAEDVHRLVQARLRHEAIDLQSATSGQQGVEMAIKLRPSAILLDLDMPVMDGFAVIRAVKNESTLSNVPILVISALSQCGDKVTAFDLGATDYVTKPFDFAELRARLRAALRTDRLLRLLSESAELDGLTALGNRASFNRRWASEVAENRRYGKPLSLAVLDIDFFKRINDTYGHQAGDEVLVEFAKILIRECRASDVACRYGGEEFAIIMPSTTAADSLVLLDRIRLAVAAAVFTRHPEHKITVSAGVCGFEGAGTLAPEQWLEAADKALYAAKRNGRNRIETAAVDGAPTLSQAG